jgi:imidazolonepropionase-like amidohydrolase
MKPEIYAATIEEAHRHGLRVAAHIYHLEDAHKLVALGVDIIAHSVRDGEIDDALLTEMKKRQVVYIVTLSLDEFAYVSRDAPNWLNDPFFQAARAALAVRAAQRRRACCRSTKSPEI